jgi:hypothetical protein
VKRVLVRTAILAALSVLAIWMMVDLFATVALLASAAGLLGVVALAWWARTHQDETRGMKDADSGLAEDDWLTAIR